MKIEVTQAHIDRGVRTNCHLCPIALAVCDMLDQAGAKYTEVTVDLTVDHEQVCVCYRDEPGPKEFRITGPARGFILRFDSSQKVYPQSFELEEICYA